VSTPSTRSVQYPPTVRIFQDVDDFQFANSSAVVGTGVLVPRADEHLSVFGRLAAVIGSDEAVGGYALFLEWCGNRHGYAKRNDYGLGLGPMVVTPDELDVNAISYALRLRARDGAELTSARGQADSFDWQAAKRFAALGTRLRPGDVLAGPAICTLDGITDGVVELEAEGVGRLTSPLGEQI
jgi:hypothetical protein